jgi:hypothetical protein
MVKVKPAGLEPAVRAKVAAWDETDGQKNMKKKKGEGTASGKKKISLIALALLTFVGALCGILAGIGVFGPGANSQTAGHGTAANTTANATANATTSTSASTPWIGEPMVAATPLVARLGIRGVTAAAFDEGASLHFRTSVGLALAVAAADIHIISFKDEAGRRQLRRDGPNPRRHLAGAHLVVEFAVLTTTPGAVLTDLKDKDKFLASVTDNLVKKGPFTLASILANIYQPPLAALPGSECYAIDKPIASSALAVAAVLEPTSTWRLPLSAAGEILVLQVQSADFVPQLGRSYEGRAWESAPGAPPGLFSCCELWCAVQLPPLLTSGDKYSLWKVPTAQTANLPKRGSRASISRMLGQATFGATRAEIDALESDGNQDESGIFKQWIRDQIALPPSLHRAYYRRRANPRIFKGLVMPQGSSRAACAPGSRWSRYAFSESDRGKEFVLTPFTGAHGAPSFSVRVDSGIERTVVSQASLGLGFIADGGPIKPTGPTNMFICNLQFGYGAYLQEWVGGMLKVSNASNECSDTQKTWNTINPAVAFRPSAPPPSLQIFSEGDISLRNVTASWKPDNDLVLESVPGVECIAGLEHLQLGSSAGPIFRRDYRLEMVENTLTSPAQDRPSHAAMSGTCPSVPATFVNRNSCVMRSSCAPLEYKSTPFTLNRTTLRRMYERSGKLFYVMENLRLDETHTATCEAGEGRSDCEPCGAKTSRWKRTSMANGGTCVSDTTVDADTKATLIRAINASLQTDKNPHVVDIDLKSLTTTGGATCVAAAAFRASIEFDGECFTHVHPQLFSVVDATYWNEDHEGNSGKFLPIKRFAEAGGTSLFFPASHAMGRWKDTLRRKRIWRIGGRLDDVVDFKDLPVESTDVELAKMFHAVAVSAKGAQHMACGSPGEVANDPALGAKYGIAMVYVDPGTNGKFDYCTFSPSVMFVVFVVVVIVVIIVIHC